MKVTQMPPVHAVNLVANSGITAYGVGIIVAYTVELPVIQDVTMLMWCHCNGSSMNLDDSFINHQLTSISV